MPKQRQSICHYLVCICIACSVSPRIKKKGGGGIEHFEAVYAVAYTLLVYTTILCCVNTVKRGVLGGKLACTCM